VSQHVVVVDDAATNLAILTAIIGGRPDTTAHGFLASSEALAFAQSAPAVDAFVLDYNMPFPDGREMIAILRSDPKFEYVPIIVVTADAERTNRLTALSAGANDFIERPVEPQELLVRLDTLLALHAARRRLADNVSDLTRSLRSEERQSRQQAERMIALWRIVSNPDYSTDELMYAILREGARAIRPGRRFAGTLKRADGEDLIIEAAARPTPLPNDIPNVGMRVPLSDTIQGALGPAPTTRAWNDVIDDPEVANRKYVRAVKIRAAIVTSFVAGRSTYYLQFWSSKPIDEPFREDDFAYVELLANYFRARLEQAWQFDRITFQLSHDSLTGLRNRTQFRLDARAALAARGAGTIAIAGLDRFRHVNETYGHIIGDALLVEVGAALQSRAIEDDVVGRLAGDTFGIFIAGAGDEPRARERIAQYCDAFSEPFSTGDREGREVIPLSATIGAAIAVDDGARIDELLSHADTALFAAKSQGRGRTTFFEEGMESEATLRSRMLDELARAVAADEFEMHFQPHIELATNQTVGAEALIRWNHPTRGLVMPEAFIPFAERNGFIRTISLWVMRATLKASEELRRMDSRFRLFFNLSALDLGDMTVVQELRNAAKRGVHLENLGVELTETAAMEDIGVTLQTIRAMQELGLEVAVDDFGTGYSSLSLLKRLPTDIVKIDRSFVSEVLEGSHDAAISESVIGFGHRFGFRTLGEGVETEEQLTWLRERGCTFAQGYLITRALPFDEFVGWLAAYRPERVGRGRAAGEQRESA
jgi:diguanylate cyclase (GGDEF)-like protein